MQRRLSRDERFYPTSPALTLRHPETVDELTLPREVRSPLPHQSSTEVLVPPPFFPPVRESIPLADPVLPTVGLQQELLPVPPPPPAPVSPLPPDDIGWVVPPVPEEGLLPEPAVVSGDPTSIFPPRPKRSPSLANQIAARNAENDKKKDSSYSLLCFIIVVIVVIVVIVIVMKFSIMGATSGSNYSSSSNKWKKSHKHWKSSKPT